MTFDSIHLYSSCVPAPAPVSNDATTLTPDMARLQAIGWFAFLDRYLYAPASFKQVAIDKLQALINSGKLDSTYRQMATDAIAKSGSAATWQTFWNTDKITAVFNDLHTWITGWQTSSSTIPILDDDTMFGIIMLDLDFAAKPGIAQLQGFSAVFDHSGAGCYTTGQAFGRFLAGYVLNNLQGHGLNLTDIVQALDITTDTGFTPTTSEKNMFNDSTIGVWALVNQGTIPADALEQASGMWVDFIISG